jgi:hypothetical protein
MSSILITASLVVPHHRLDLALDTPGTIDWTMLPAPTFAAQGTPSCPCIDGAKLISTRAPSLYSAAVPEGMCHEFVDPSGVCLGESYGGSVCLPRDNPSTEGESDRPGQARCQLATPPNWCDASWCWVDATTCPPGVSYPPSGEIRFRARQIPTNISLHYSYKTCGFRDTFTNPETSLISALRNLTLRVTAPDVVNPTPHFWRTTRGEIQPDGEDWNGPVWWMLEEFA